MPNLSADFLYNRFDEDSVRIAEEVGMLIVTAEHIGFDENMGDVSVFEFAFMYNERDEALILEAELEEDADGTAAFSNESAEVRASWILDQIRKLSDECTESEQSALSSWGGAANYVADDVAGKIAHSGEQGISVILD